MVLNMDQNTPSFPPELTVTDQVTYLGIQITTSVSSIAKVNYINILKKVGEDISRWMPYVTIASSSQLLE